jgi:hypothetical protein
MEEHKDMENVVNGNREQENEAIRVAAEYCVKLENAINNAVHELTENRQPDTDEYVKDILNGLNWTIQVYNGTREYLAELGAGIDEAAVNAAVADVAESFKANDDAAKARALGGEMLDFVRKMKDAEKLI